jgi:hypothetical protein
VERFAWGEHNNPTGVGIFDTDTGKIEFIETHTREWLDVKRTKDNYLAKYDGIMVEDSIVRVNITATQAEYHTLDMVKLRKKLDKSLEYSVRRVEPIVEPEEEPTSIINSSLFDSWKEHISKKRMPSGVSKKEIEEAGISAIDRASK